MTVDERDKAMAAAKDIQRAADLKLAELELLAMETRVKILETQKEKKKAAQEINRLFGARPRDWDAVNRCMLGFLYGRHADLAHQLKEEAKIKVGFKDEEPTQIEQEKEKG